MSAKKIPEKKVAASKKRGRPSKYSEALAAEICERVSKGEPLAVICRDIKMPAVQTVADWKEKNERFSLSIARAREEGFDAIAAQCLEISDDEKHDWKMTKKGVITDEVAIGRARLQVDTRLKLLAKWDPKRYGDKLDMKTEHSGSISLGSVLAEINTAGLPRDDG